ncbi:MAG: hypothetical protein HC877_20160 [Thioploca sp.]|nr:hypothetical protein [Thioploca sp.]
MKYSLKLSSNFNIREPSNIALIEITGLVGRDAELGRDGVANPVPLSYQEVVVAENAQLIRGKGNQDRFFEVNHETIALFPNLSSP